MTDTVTTAEPDTGATPAAPAETVPVQSAPDPGTGESAPAPAAVPDTGTAPAADSPDELAKWKALAQKHETRARSNKEELDRQAAELKEIREQQEAQRNAFAIALGIKAEDVTPEQLAERAQLERDAARAESTQHAAQKRAADVELAVLRSAYASGVNGNALLDSRAFVATVTGLDPAAEDFGARVTEAIEAAVTANPGYKAAITPTPAAGALTPPAASVTPPPTIPRSGGEFNGAPGGQRQLTEEDAARMSPAEVWDAMKNGLFAGEGFAKPKTKRY